MADADTQIPPTITNRWQPPGLADLPPMAARTLSALEHGSDLVTWHAAEVSRDVRHTLAVLRRCAAVITLTIVVATVMALWGP